MAYLRISWYWQMITFSEQCLKASLLGLGHFGVPVYKKQSRLLFWQTLIWQIVIWHSAMLSF